METLARNLDDILVPIALFVTIATIFRLQKGFARVRLDKAAEVQKHLMDKFQSGRELADFIATEEGRRFMRQLQGSASSPHGARFLALGAGIVLSFLGTGLLLLQAWVPTTDGDAGGAGLIFLSIGIGLVVAGAVSRHLFKKWSEEDNLIETGGRSSS